MPKPPVASRGHGLRRLDQSSLLSLLGYHLRRADVRMDQTFRKCISKPFKLKPVEFSVLSLITVNTGVTYKELGEALNVAGPNLALIIASMQKRKLVIRRPNPLDGRSMFLEASPKGQKLLVQVRAAVEALESELLAGWSAEQRDTLFRMLSKLHRIGSG